MACTDNSKSEQNRYYDMYYFFNTFITEDFPQFMEEQCIPQNAKDFVNRIIEPIVESMRFLISF